MKMKNREKRLANRRAAYDRMSTKSPHNHLHHRPGSLKK